VSANTLPPWARIKQLPLEMVAARDFRPGDTLYFSERAYPRVLWQKLSESSWSVLVQRDNRHERGQISIEPDSCYVVKRATPRKASEAPVPGTCIDDFFLNRPLTSIRVEGEHLAVGDVVYLDVHRKKAEILEIGTVYTSLMRGIARDARLNFLDLDKIAPYTFSGFRIAPPFQVVAGPKFAAARQDTALIFWRTGVNRWHWKG
jgi:hypothetical protein